MGNTVLQTENEKSHIFLNKKSPALEKQGEAIINFRLN